MVMVRNGDDASNNPVDVYVGSRLRLSRIARGLSQERLARELGISFQQIQKYERGFNRISASRLYELSRILDVSVTYFFADMPAEIAESPVSRPRGQVRASQQAQDAFAPAIDEQLGTPETRELIEAYYKIDDPIMRRRMYVMIKSLGAEDASREAA